MTADRKRLFAKKIAWPLAAILLVCVHICVQAVLGHRHNVTELAPGVSWTRIGRGASKITWEGKGVVAKGALQVYFCEAGIGVCFAREDKPELYLDIIGNKVMTMDQALMIGRRKRIDRVNVPMHVFMIEGALGTYTDWSVAKFVRDRDLFVKRIELLKAGKPLE
jgi:hypothetical protein